MTKAIAVKQAAAVDPLMALVERAASDPNFDVTKMQAILDARAKEQDRDSARAFDEAMAKAQTEMRPIAADATNPQTRSKYASLPALDRALRPIYTRHGFALSFDTEPTSDKFVRVLCYVSCAGHRRTYRKDMPVTTTGLQGKANMTEIHAHGSAVTYGQRYLLKMIFNISVGDDDDGNAAGDASEKIMPDQVAALEKMVIDIGGERRKELKDATLAYFGIAGFEEVPVSEYNRVLTAIAKKGGK